MLQGVYEPFHEPVLACRSARCQPCLLDIDLVKNMFDRVYDRILRIVWKGICYISLIGRVGNEPSHDPNINFGSVRRAVVAYILQFSTP